MSQKYSEAEVGKHNCEKDCWLIIGNEKTGGQKVYDVTKYLNDHPGGPEIILDLAGKNADEMFEDIGHSSEARSKMKEFVVGTLLVDETEPKVAAKKSINPPVSKGGLNPYAVILLLIAIAIGIYFSLQK